MKTINFQPLILAALLISGACCHSKSGATGSSALKDCFAGEFMIGAAINQKQVEGTDSLGRNLILQHFNTIVAENVMKSESLAPAENTFNWAPADSFVNFGTRHGMFIVGHALVWHSQLAHWFPYQADGKTLLDSASMANRLSNYIHTVVGRYRGKVHAWDVVNEAITDDGKYRESPFYKAMGPAYIALAFKWAHEADPEAQLYINDYGMTNPARRDAYVRIVKNLKEQGIRIDAIGMQGHMGIDYPNLTDYDETIGKLASTRCKVMLTEWDMSALPTVTESANISVADSIDAAAASNPYTAGLPPDVAAVWNERMDSVLAIIRKHASVISRVNAWGVTDGDSWKNSWPVPGRTDYPLLFDRNGNPKPFLNKYLNNKK